MPHLRTISRLVRFCGAASCLAAVPAASQTPAPAPAPAPAAEPAPEPWYDRAECLALASAVYTPDFERANRQMMRLEASSDPDALACAVYWRVVYAEMQIAVSTLSPGNTEYREYHLQRMLALAKKYGHLGRRFADFEAEAWTRRVRTYFEEGRTMDAVGAARTGFALVEARAAVTPAEPSPMQDFARGTFDSAFGHANAGLRVLFRMAGISGDLQRGFISIRRLTEGKSVYRHEGQYIAFHFARERADSPFGAQSKWAEQLHRSYPKNPQYLLDLGVAWRGENRCQKTMELLAPELAAYAAGNERWDPLMRAKLYWIAGMCALDLGDQARAKDLAARCRKQGARDWQPRLEELEERLNE